MAAGDAQDPSGYLAGPFTPGQTRRIERLLTAARSQTKLGFTLYVGQLSEPTRDHAVRLLGRLEQPDRAVLIAVSPNQRVLEIVTGNQARSWLPDRECSLAALSMVSAFSEGNLVGGVVSGLAQLAAHAARSTSS